MAVFEGSFRASARMQLEKLWAASGIKASFQSNRSFTYSEDAVDLLGSPHQFLRKSNSDASEQSFVDISGERTGSFLQTPRLECLDIGAVRPHGRWRIYGRRRLHRRLRTQSGHSYRVILSGAQLTKRLLITWMALIQSVIHCKKTKTC